MDSLAVGPYLKRYLQRTSFWGRTPVSPDGDTGVRPQNEGVCPQNLQAHFENHPVNSDEELIFLMEELVLMKQPKLALLIARVNAEREPENHVHAVIMLGSAHMLQENFSEAERYFIQAHKLKGSEVAPYHNLIGLYYSQNRDDECLQWCLKGLEAHSNSEKIWQYVAALYNQKFDLQAGEEILKLAKKFSSWVGCSLAAHYIAPEDPLYKAELLGDFYHQAVVDWDFLCEYTGALGVSTQYDKIPAILWSAENFHSTPRSNLPWRLCLHGAQAFLGLENFKQAENYATKALKDPLLPGEVRDGIFEMLKEINEHLAGETP